MFQQINKIGISICHPNVHFFAPQVWQMAENIYNDEELDTPASEVE